MSGDLISRSVLLERMGNVVFKNVPVEHQPYVQVACDTFKAVAKTASTVDAVEVVRCKDCIYRGNTSECPMCWTEWFDDPFDGTDSDSIMRDYTTDDGFCHCGAKMDKEE